jgi:predicted CoA-binding protein
LLEAQKAPERDWIGGIVHAAIAVGAKVLWNQLDVVSSDLEPERRSKIAGLKVVSNRWMRIEHERLKIAPKTFPGPKKAKETMR